MRFIRTLKTRKGKPIDFTHLEPRLLALCKKFDLELLYIFGSYAQGKADLLSDVDIAYYTTKKVNPLKLLPELEDLFEEEAIDLVNLRQASLPLIHRVLKYGKCLYAKDLKIKIQFETEAECHYFDTAPLRQTYFASMLQRIKHGTFGVG